MPHARKQFCQGEKVSWRWMGREIVGFIKEIHFESVSQAIKGKVIKRNGSLEKPAYLVESEAGNLALKLHSELNVFEEQKIELNRPKIFGGR
jgi:hypothetical protein